MGERLELSELVAATKPFDGYLFARGYVMSSQNPPVAPEGWARGTFGSYHLAYDPRLEITRAEQETTSILCLGILFDPRTPSKTTEECVSDLLGALEESEETLLAEMGFMMGRHVVAYQRDKSFRLVTDAASMRAAFYLQRDGLVASHMNLIALNSDHAEERPPITYRMGYPGMRTPRRYIRMLTPNTRLNLRTLKPSRFWPSEALETISLEEAVARVVPLFMGGFEHVASRWRPLVSLTAGIDTRSTVATGMHFENTRFFTYRMAHDQQAAELDPSFALDFAAKTGRDVQIIEADFDEAGEAEWPAYDELLRINCFSAHARKAAYKYFQLYGRDPHEYVHLRSNISEVAKQTYGRRKVTRDVDITRVWLRRLPSDYPVREVFGAIEAFGEFAEVTQFFDCTGLIDLCSLYHWEHKMTSWHSQVITHADPAFETLSLYNCREVLRLMLSADIADREAGRVHKGIAAALWPELTEMPINGEPFWSYLERATKTEAVEALDPA